MGLRERLPGLSSLRSRLGGLLSKSDDVDGHALWETVQAAGPEGSSHRLIAIVSTYEALKGRLDPKQWHLQPGLMAFVQKTGAHIPMIPAPILARMLESQGTAASPRAFLSQWEADGYPVEATMIDASELFSTIVFDLENAEAFVERSSPSESGFYLRYVQWHYSLATAQELGAKRVIELGGSGGHFGKLLTASLPGAQLCEVDDARPEGLTEAQPGVGLFGAPPHDLGLFEDESVDLVVAHNRFQRLLGDDDLIAIAEIERVLVRGGRCLIAPFMVADRHALTVSPFSCFIANGDTDYAAAIEVEIEQEYARIDFNTGVVTPITRRYDVASAKRRLLQSAPNMTARLRTFTFADEGFDASQTYSDRILDFPLRFNLFEKQTFLALEFIKH